MSKPAIEPFDNIAPVGDQLTDYDRTHLKLYARLLDAVADGADWRRVVEVLFGIDPRLEEERARRVHDSHLERARWMAEAGYRHLLSKPTPGSDDPVGSG